MSSVAHSVEQYDNFGDMETDDIFAIQNKKDESMPRLGVFENQDDETKRLPTRNP